jgi:hypothetical protein
MSVVIHDLPADELVGRLVQTTNGTQYIVNRLAFDAASGCVMIYLREVYKGTVVGEESGVTTLDGWSVHSKLMEV